MITMYLNDLFGIKLTTASSFHPSGTQDNHPRNKNTQPEAQQEHWSAKLKHSRVEAKDNDKQVLTIIQSALLIYIVLLV